MKYDDVQYLKDYYEQRKFPRIHDDIYSMAEYCDKDCNVLDLGCCFGLLSVRLSSVFNKVVGIESSRRYLQSAIEKDNVIYYLLKVDFSTIDRIKEILLDNDIKIVFARRVFPEIVETNGIELLDALIDAFAECGVHTIVLEGRVRFKNAVNLLPSVDEEIVALGRRYELVNKYKDCALLRIKDEGI